MSDDDNPKFERDASHTFRVNEEVYMIDPNGFDIWEATIVKIDESDGISVHYPQYPDDDETVKETSRILPKTRINTRIFKEQEKQRQMGEEEEYDLEAQDEEGDDYAPGDGAKE